MKRGPILFAALLLLLTPFALAQEPDVGTLPGEFGYGAKLIFEEVRLLTTFNEERKMSLQGEFAQKRLDEAKALATGISKRKVEMEDGGSVVFLHGEDGHVHHSATYDVEGTLVSFSRYAAAKPVIVATYAEGEVTSLMQHDWVGDDLVEVTNFDMHKQPLGTTWLDAAGRTIGEAEYERGELKYLKALGYDPEGTLYFLADYSTSGTLQKVTNYAGDTIESYTGYVTDPTGLPQSAITRNKAGQTVTRVDFSDTSQIQKITSFRRSGEKQSEAIAGDDCFFGDEVTVHLGSYGPPATSQISETAPSGGRWDYELQNVEEKTITSFAERKELVFPQKQRAVHFDKNRILTQVILYEHGLPKEIAYFEGGRVHKVLEFQRKEDLIVHTILVKNVKGTILQELPISPSCAHEYGVEETPIKGEKKIFTPLMFSLPQNSSSIIDLEDGEVHIYHSERGISHTATFDSQKTLLSVGRFNEDGFLSQVAHFHNGTFHEVIDYELTPQGVTLGSTIYDRFGEQLAVVHCAPSFIPNVSAVDGIRPCIDPLDSQPLQWYERKLRHVPLSFQQFYSHAYNLSPPMQRSQNLSIGVFSGTEGDIQELHEVKKITTEFEMNTDVAQEVKGTLEDFVGRMEEITSLVDKEVVSLEHTATTLLTSLGEIERIMSVLPSSTDLEGVLKALRDLHKGTLQQITQQDPFAAEEFHRSFLLYETHRLHRNVMDFMGSESCDGIWFDSRWVGTHWQNGSCIPSHYSPGSADEFSSSISSQQSFSGISHMSLQREVNTMQRLLDDAVDRGYAVQEIQKDFAASIAHLHETDFRSHEEPVPEETAASASGFPQNTTPLVGNSSNDTVAESS